MFDGNQEGMNRVLGRVLALARGLGHARAGSEHLLLALAAGGGPVAAILAGHGATVEAVTLDPGAGWVLTHAGVRGPALLAGLAAAFPPPRRNALLRAERHLGRRSRHRGIVRRYQRQTGRTATAAVAVATLIAG